MRIKILTFLIIIATTFSCNEKKQKQVYTDSKDEILNETPEILDNSDDYKIRSISKRNSSDILVELYNEALEKDAKLKQLNDEINQIYQTKNDSLVAYSKFSQTNNEYWLSATKHINQLQDSVLRESTLEVFKAIESNYQAKMADYDPKINEIKTKSISLNDQLILMKLFITKSMMANYQLNEKPTIKTLQNVIDKYDKLIQESEKYTKIK